MDESDSTNTQIAQAASAFDQQRTGHVRKAVTVALSNHTLVTALHGSLLVAEHTPMRRLLVSDEVIGFEFERSRLLAHESEREPERPGSTQIPGLLLQPGVAEGTGHTFKAAPSEPGDEHGGVALRSLSDPYPKIPELYYG